jgi:tetratricopeptide (TPR) repeat protein
LVKARKLKWTLPALIVVLGLATLTTAARQIDPSQPPPPPRQDNSAPIDTSQPPPPPPSATPSPDTKPADSAATPAKPPAPAFDPLHAQKSVEVGEYYLQAGDYDAAIDRFREAIGLQSNFALPWDLLGQAYEKEHDRDDAITAYQKYLVLLPDGKEPDRVRKRVAKLQADAASDAAKQSRK